MSTARFTGLLAVCTMLAACDRPTTPTADVTEPKSRPAFLTADAGILEQYLVRADQEGPAFSAEQLLTDLAAFGDPSILQSSGTTECVGVLVGTFDRVEVPPGTPLCLLVNSIVREWVHADEGSRLAILNSQIGGNVKGLSALAVQVLARTHVQGHVTVDNAGDTQLASCAVGFPTATIDGNFHCMHNNPAAPRIEGPNTIGGSVDVIGNISPPTFFFNVVRNTIGNTAHVSNNEGANVKRVQLNVIAKTLVCQNNDPLFIGGPNVARNVQGQCF